MEGPLQTHGPEPVVADDWGATVPDVPYRLRPGPEQVAVLLDCPDPSADLDRWSERIRDDLVDMGLPEYPDIGTIRRLLADACPPGQDLIGHTLVMGRAPVPSLDAHLSWPRDFFASGWVVDEHDRIDYREKIERCSVRRNELLLRLHHAVDGEPGLDIFMNAIPVGKPERLRVRCGKGVNEVDETTSTAFYAAHDGRLRFVDGTITVDEVYHVSGDIGLGTGNIHHTGSVTVDGDIRDGSVVEADGDIVVKGMIEKATVICGGNLTVAGGILGEPGRKVRVVGDLEAKYINKADVKVQGEIRILRQILQSQVAAIGAIKVPTGRIAGGRTIALKGIETGTAGAPGATHTELVSGVDYSLDDQMAIYYRKIARLEKTLEPIEAQVQHATADPAKAEQPEFRQVIESLAAQRMLIQESISEQYMHLDAMQQAAAEQARFHVVVFEAIWSGTVVELGEAVTAVKRSIEKPRIAVRREDRARIVPLGPANLPNGVKLPKGLTLPGDDLAG